MISQFNFKLRDLLALPFFGLMLLAYLLVLFFAFVASSIGEGFTCEHVLYIIDNRKKDDPR